MLAFLLYSTVGSRWYEITEFVQNLKSSEMRVSVFRGHWNFLYFPTWTAYSYLLESIDSGNSGGGVCRWRSMRGEKVCRMVKTRLGRDLGRRSFPDGDDQSKGGSVTDRPANTATAAPTENVSGLAIPTTANFFVLLSHNSATFFPFLFVFSPFWSMRFHGNIFLC